MRWGVRRTSDNKRHLGIDEKGNLNIIKGKTTRKAVKNFAMRAGVFALGMGIAAYIRKHPESVIKGADTVKKILSIHGTKTVSSVSKIVEDSGFYSKTLGRVLSIEEAISKGLL